MNIKALVAILAITGARATSNSLAEQNEINVPLRGNTFVTSCADSHFETVASEIIDTWTGEINRPY